MLLAGASAARAQSEGTIRGQVVAAGGDAALAGVAVRLSSVPAGRPLHATTDMDGRFVFQHVRPGEYVVSTFPDGFTGRQVGIVLEPREVRVVTLMVDVSRIGVTVDVTAPLAPSEGTHSPSSTVLSAEHIEAVPIGRRSSLADVLLATAPGMVRADNDFVHVRGHEIGLGILINGVSFWENPLPAYSAGVSPEVVDVANIITGGFPAEYGNRFGGVMDIVTKSGLTMSAHGSVVVSGGQAGRASVAGEFGGRRDRFGYYGAVSGLKSNWFQNAPDRESIHNAGAGIHAFGQADLTLGTAGSLRALLMPGATNFDIPVTTEDADLRPAASAEQRIWQQTAIVGWTRAASRVALGTTIYQRRSRSHTLPAADSLSARAEVDRTLSTLGGKADAAWLVGRQTVKAGIDVVRLRPREGLFYDYSGYADFLETLDAPRLHFAGGPVRFSATETGGQVSGYLQGGLQIGNRVTADLGVRVDRYRLASSGTHASPRLNIALRVGAETLLHASYNRFFVPPPVEGVLSTSAGLTGRIEEIGVQLPPLPPATEDQFELGASTPAGPLRLSATAYYRLARNAVHTTVWPDSRVYNHASFERVRAHGLETRVSAPGLAARGLTVWLNYAFGRVDYHNPVTGGFVTEPDHVTGTDRFLAPMDQLHTLTAGLTYRHSRSGLSFGAATEYGSGTPREQGEETGDGGRGEGGAAGRVPGHFATDVLVGVDLLRDERGRARVSLRLDIENVTDSTYVIAQEQAAFGPALFSRPRLVSISATARFW